MSKKKVVPTVPAAGIEQTRIVKAGRAAAKVATPTAKPVEKAVPTEPTLIRTTVLLSPSDREAVLAAKGQPTDVCARATSTVQASEKQAAYRKAYVQRPEVKEKMKAYRARRAAAKRAATVAAVIQQADDQARKVGGRKGRKG
jgi:hypothetical protein